jgi:hypothetical protein
VFPEEIAGCPGSSCMSTLQRQLAIVFTGKQVIQQIKQLAKPILKSWRRKRKEAASLAKQAKVSGAGGLSGCGWLCARVLSHRGGMPA